jgi:prophage regulatory protein
MSTLLLIGGVINLRIVNEPTTGCCLRVQAVAKKLGVAVSTVWNWTKERETFPKPFPMGQNVTVWFESDLDAFIAAQAAPTRT